MIEFPCTLPEADAFAARMHAGQVRKYTGEPYINHPREVLAILQLALADFRPHGAMFKSLEGLDFFHWKCAALLHDTVEDTSCTYKDITEHFGEDICELVYYLTDNVSMENGGNRETRKRLEANKFKHAPSGAGIVKLCDLISNTDSICEHDPAFAVQYMKECSYIFECIVQSTIAHDPYYDLRWFLIRKLKSQLDAYQATK